MNGAAFCPECGSRMVIKSTNHGGGITYRVAECDCGEKWETEERRARRLPPSTAVSARIRPSTGTGDRPPPPTAVHPPFTDVGVGGSVSSDLVLSLSDPDPIPSLVVSPNRARESAPQADRFPEFWELYPLKKARKAALKNWIRAKLDQHADVIIAAIQLQRDEFLQRESPSLIPHAATWLNGERWKDEPDRNPRPVGRPRTHQDIALAAAQRFMDRHQPLPLPLSIGGAK